MTAENLEVGLESFDDLAKVIDDVNLFIGRGEIVIIVGEAGYGKSVTVKSTLRPLNQPPTCVSDDIIFDGTKLLSFSDHELERVEGQRVNPVFRDPMLGPNLMFAIGERLIDTAQFGSDSDMGVVEFFHRRFSGRRDEARERVLETPRGVQMLDPENIMDSYPLQLSGEMRRHTLIVQALLNESDLSITGEIGTALDMTIHDQILDLLEDLIENHDLSVLMIAHNLSVARQVNDRVYVMYGSRIVETVPTDELLENPKHPYTQGFIASIPRLAGDEMATGIDGSIPEYLDPPPGCRFAPQCPHTTAECREIRPKMHEHGPQTGVERVLYDEVVPASERPTVEETRSHMTR